jgi:hypothetical protein
MSMTEGDNGQGLWAGIFARLEASIGGLDSSLRRRNTLDAFAREINLRLPVSPPAVAGTISVVNLGSPPEGYWWQVRAVRALGPKAAAGTELVISNVNLDLYVTSLALVGIVPPSGDWQGSSGSSAVPGGVPTTLAPSYKETVVSNGDYVVAVLSGAGVAGTQFVLTLAVTQFQGFTDMKGDRS